MFILKFTSSRIYIMLLCEAIPVGPESLISPFPTITPNSSGLSPTLILKKSTESFATQALTNKIVIINTKI